MEAVVWIGEDGVAGNCKQLGRPSWKKVTKLGPQVPPISNVKSEDPYLISLSQILLFKGQE